VHPLRKGAALRALSIGARAARERVALVFDSLWDMWTFHCGMFDIDARYRLRIFSEKLTGNITSLMDAYRGQSTAVSMVVVAASAKRVQLFPSR
jgi:hypothetical protein